MTSFVFKLIINPVALWLSALLFDGLEFGRWTQPIILGAVIAVAGIVLELLFLKRGTLWISTVLDWAAVTMLVYYITPMFDGAVSNFTGSLLTGLLFAFVEYFLHRYLISAGLTQKRERA
ncbi:DUF2512 family protein [Gorillibacterium sp. sgz5001074]|uniref:DUF2512 family protein n=1 Tax=Gorillibacterium sp. sgz5001074 TaxID=3446695 RepID=UPI003F664B44